MSFILCGRFISFMADTARAGAAAMPACKYKFKLSSYASMYTQMKALILRHATKRVVWDKTMTT